MKWEKVLTSELISSDESEVDNDDKAVLVVKKLAWRSDRVTNFFAKLDSAHEDHAVTNLIIQAVTRTNLVQKEKRLRVIIGTTLIRKQIPLSSSES